MVVRFKLFDDEDKEFERGYSINIKLAGNVCALFNKF